jgi:hypothetical protein
MRFHTAISPMFKQKSKGFYYNTRRKVEEIVKAFLKDPSNGAIHRDRKGEHQDAV